MPTRGCGMDPCRGVGQTPCKVHLCPAVFIEKDVGGKETKVACREPVTLTAIYRPGDPQVTVPCPNSKELRPHDFTIFTVHNPEKPELHGTFQVVASAEFPS